MPSATVPQNREQRRRKRAPERYIPKLGSIIDAAEFLDCNPRTVRRMLQDGKLSAYRVGRHLKVDMVEVYDLARPVPPESVSA